MFAVLLWFAAGLAIVVGARYAIMRWLSSDEPQGPLDKSEARLQSMMRWFTSNWPDSTVSRRHDTHK